MPIFFSNFIDRLSRKISIMLFMVLSSLWKSVTKLIKT